MGQGHQAFTILQQAFIYLGLAGSEPQFSNIALIILLWNPTTMQEVMLDSQDCKVNFQTAASTPVLPSHWLAVLRPLNLAKMLFSPLEEK